MVIQHLASLGGSVEGACCSCKDSPVSLLLAMSCIYLGLTAYPD